MDKKILENITKIADEYGEEWIIEHMNKENKENKDYLLSMSYEKFEKYLTYNYEDSFLLPLDYDIIFENLNVDMEEDGEYIENLTFLISTIFSVAVKSAYNYIHMEDLTD